jgi:signal transduction histidine kinase
MEWAFQRGTSTKPGIGRGIGLDLLRDFVQKNGGRLEMFSHEGYAVIANGQTAFAGRRDFFEGTLVNISLRCDEKYYCLASELSNEPPF